MNCFYYEELAVDQKATFSKNVTNEMMDAFRAITGDENPLHTDKDYAQSAGYSDRIVFGMLSAALLSTLAGVYLPGKYSLIQTVEVEFASPVFVGDTLTVEGVVTNKYDEFKVIKLKVTVFNQHGEKVCRGKMRVGVLK